MNTQLLMNDYSIVNTRNSLGKTDNRIFLRDWCMEHLNLVSGNYWNDLVNIFFKSLGYLWETNILKAWKFLSEYLWEKNPTHLAHGQIMCVWANLGSKREWFRAHFDPKQKKRHESFAYSWILSYFKGNTHSCQIVNRLRGWIKSNRIANRKIIFTFLI